MLPPQVCELAEWTLAVQFFSVTFFPKSGLKLSLFPWPDKMDDVGWIIFLFLPAALSKRLMLCRLPDFQHFPWCRHQMDSSSN